MENAGKKHKYKETWPSRVELSCKYYESYVGFMAAHDESIKSELERCLTGDVRITKKDIHGHRIIEPRGAFDGRTEGYIRLLIAIVGEEDALQVLDSLSYR